MDRHVIAHRNHFTGSVKDGARVVATFLDIRREGSSPQGRSHFFGDGVIQILENFEFDRVPHSPRSLRQDGRGQGSGRGAFKKLLTIK
jgi:hypothetical protein